MKKKQIQALLLASFLFLSACNTNTSSSYTPPGDTTETTTTVEENIEEHTKENTETDNTENSIAKDESIQDTVTIIFEKNDLEHKADNGDLIFSTNISYPVVTIKDNPDATKKINDSIQEQLHIIQEDIETTKEDAISFYEISANDEYPSSSFSYYDYFEHRIDEKIISFQRNDYFFLGGAHGQGVSSGFNYDTKTGDLLTLNDIFTDPELATEQIKAHLSYLASLPYYRELMYEDSDPDVSCLLERECWYFAKDGIHFIAEPYLLGPYASGEINFTIPYEKLPDLKESYRYDTFLLHTSLIGESMTAYLDADDDADSIILDVLNQYDNMSDTDEYVGSTFSLEINGTDFSNDLMASIEYLSDNFCPHFYVVDLNKKDKYKELLISDYGYNDEQLTHFFRYENDTLKYLGTVPSIPENDYFIINGDGTLLALMYPNLLQTPYIPALYELKGDTLSLADTDWYEINEKSWNDEFDGHNILTDVIVYKEADLDSETVTLTPNVGPVTFLATDNKNWYQLQTKDGTLYYLYMTDFSTVPNGGTDMYTNDIFDNLMIAG